MSTPTLSPTQTGPSARPWWLAAGAVLVLGILVGVAWSTIALLQVVDRPAGFARTTVPGSVSVQLTRGERSVVYAESRPLNDPPRAPRHRDRPRRRDRPHAPLPR